ncbi:MAG: glycoside hydrolase family 2 protein [Christensenellales bacterium]
MPCELPCDIHMPLEEAGIIRDVTKADYCYEAEWTEHRSWWFVNDFEATEEDVASDVIELTLESLDGYADIFFNGVWIGSHISAHYPFFRGIKNHLRVGKNQLTVRMTTGMESVSDDLMSEINWAVCTEENNNCTDRSDKRRGCMRKPQYVVGWDWGPKAITCGIVKNAYIRCYNKVAIRAVHMYTTEIMENAVNVHLTAELDQLNVISTRDCDFKLTMSLEDQEWTFEKKDVLLTSGLNYLDMDIVLPDAKLWWPAGYGDQPLYNVKVSVDCEGIVTEYPEFELGLRTVELDTSRVDEKSRNFFLVINGVRVFCKGGNWIPSDSIYARVTDQKYITLIDEAKEAGFNTLRIWGGGIYERDVFYRHCDRQGLLIWHDFMFGCASYPDHLDWFMNEVKREMRYQTRRLRNHACMALWCGNNENHWIFNKVNNPHWGLEHSYEYQYGLRTANEAAKVAVRENCSEIPYWNSSPYGGELPNDETCGDTHHWGQCTMNPNMAKRIEPKEYDKVLSRFVTEYGYVGPCCKESIAEFFDGNEIDRNSKIWRLHNNTFEKDTVLAGIEKHYLDQAADLNLDDYILYAGMVQSMMLEYSLEAIRFKNFCGGGLFWMYNDTWCEVGWTIIDYYLRRKISFYGVKRAFAPVKLSLRMVGGKVRVQGCNDTSEDIVLNAKVGYVAFDGSGDRTEKHEFVLKAQSRVYLGDFDLPEGDYTTGTFMVIPENDVCVPGVLRVHDTRCLRYAGAKPKVLGVEKYEGGMTVILTADAYIHGVHLKGNYPMSDNYFDLVPGQVKKVDIKCDRVEGIEWCTVL